MLPLETLRAVESAVRDLDDRQVAWMSGYLAGLRAGAPGADAPGGGSSLVIPEGARAAAPDLADAATAASATILYGSQSGNAKSAATALAERIRKGGGAAEVFDMARYKTAALKREKFLCVVVSTQGEGDPPDSAARFYEFLHGSRAPRLDDAHFAVLALGDSGYEHFCKTGREMDKRLAELGAKRIAPVTECDVDFEDAAAEWRERVVGELLRKPQVNGAALDSAQSALSVSGEPRAWSRQNPFAAEVIANIRLTGSDPDKRVHHLEFSLEGSGMTYAPGDSLGVWPQNPDWLVSETLDTLGATGDDIVEIRGEPGKLLDWLSRRLELSPLSPAVVARWAELKDAPELAGRDAAAAFAKGRTAADLFRRVPARGDIGGALGALRKMSPRLYSLASSHGAREGEAHALAGVCRHMDARGKMQSGLCSGYLAELSPGKTARVFVHENEHFRLPEEDDAAMIMIGPGTGVAPFRAFLEEREFRGAKGRNWLFFGERNRREHFFYQTEFQQWRADGLLTRLDAAFSRDGPAKVYVQHKMLARAEELWRWIGGGASVYVCGDEKRMAKDVESALRKIAREQGGMSEDAAAAFWVEMRDAGRYQRDVY